MPVDLDHLRAQVEVLRYVRARKAELRQLEDNARDAIEEALGDCDTGTIDGKPAVKWSFYKRTDLDRKALEDAYPEIYAACAKTSQLRRFGLVDE